jgi:pSer/pThr/pTyr-binding forkhead associated (FHA) protein
MKVSLLVAEGIRAGMEVPVAKFPFLMGRSPSCHLRPASDMVSKQHCCLLTRAGKVYVHDFNSRNGTFVNGERVTRPTELHDGDALTVGKLGFTVRLIDAVPVDQATPLPEHRADLPGPDEDEVGNLLLEMDANEVEPEAQPHSTTVEIEVPPAPANSAAVPSPVHRPASPPKPTASTADAAQKILSQMARRDRK